MPVLRCITKLGRLTLMSPLDGAVFTYPREVLGEDRQALGDSKATSEQARTRSTAGRGGSAHNSEFLLIEKICGIEFGSLPYRERSHYFTVCDSFRLTWPSIPK
jgi:hypothetical protein